MLERAEKLRARGKKKKAIAEYRKVLAIGPDDPAIHGKLAPLLAATGQREQALQSFRASAEGHIKAGFVDRAIAVYVQAANAFPTDEALWTQIANLHLQRARRADAVRTYVDAHQHFRGKKGRPTAIAMLQRAVELEPLNVKATLLLARALKKAGEKDKAQALLANLAKQIRGPALRQIRRAQAGLSPTPAALWRWLTGR